MKSRYYVRGIGIGMAVTAAILHFSVNAAKEPEMTDAEVMERARALGMVESIVLSENDPTIAGRNPLTDVNHSQGNDENTDTEGTASSQFQTAGDGDTELHGEGADGADGSTDADGTGAGGAGGSTGADGTGAGGADGSTDADGAGGAGGNAGVNGNSGTGADDQETDILHAGDGSNDTGAEQTEGMAGSSQQNGISFTIVNGDSSYSVAGRLAQQGLVSSQGEYDRYLCTHGYDRKIRTGVHFIPAGASEQQIAEIITSSANVN